MLQRNLLNRQQLRQALQSQARSAAAWLRGTGLPAAAPARTFLSLCMPAANEEANIQETLDEAFAILPELVDECEVVVTNDGSRDRTGEILERYQADEKRLRVVTHGTNQGYGAALTAAIRAAQGELVCTVDSDGQFCLLDVAALLQASVGHDVVLGYREQRADHCVRRFNAWAWSKLVAFVLGVSVKDLDCALKLYRREVVDGLTLTATGACISAQIIAQCVRPGMRIAQVPVSHLPRCHGSATGAALSVIARAFWELPRLQRYRRQYRSPTHRAERPLVKPPEMLRYTPGAEAWEGLETNGQATATGWRPTESPLTICVLAACPFPANHGTSGSIREMAEASAERGHEVHVICYHHGDDASLDNIQLHRISPLLEERPLTVGPSMRRPLYDLQMVVKTLEVIRLAKPVLLHAHGHEAMLAASICRVFTGIPVVYSAHNMMTDELPSYFSRALRWPAHLLGCGLDSLVPRLADRCIPHSLFLERFLRSKRLLSRCEPMINFGIDLDSAAVGDKLALLAQYNLEGRPTVVYAGVLNAFQRLDLLLEAMCVVAKEIPAARLLLVTTLPSEELSSKLRADVARLGLTDHVIITPPQPLGRVKALIAACDVGVVPRTGTPGFPIKMLNYMAAGIASVAYASSAAGPQHMQDAYLVTPETGPALGHGIVALLSDERLRSGLAERGRRYVRQHHDRRDMARGLSAVYARAALGLAPGSPVTSTDAAAPAEPCAAPAALEPVAWAEQAMISTT